MFSMMEIIPVSSQLQSSPWVLWYLSLLSSVAAELFASHVRFLKVQHHHTDFFQRITIFNSRMPFEPLRALPSRRHRSSSFARDLHFRLQQRHSTSCFQGLGSFVGWTWCLRVKPSNYRSNTTNNRMLWINNFLRLRNFDSTLMLSDRRTSLQPVDFVSHRM